MPLDTILDVKLVGDREVALTRVFDAPRRLVFDAHTKPELVRRWLLGPPGWTMPTCEVDLRVGGRIRYVWRGPNGETMGMSGTFREVVPPDRLVHTELFDEDWQGGGVETTTVFVETAGKTTVEMTMRFASAEAREAALATGMARGMGQSYDRLAEMLAAEGRSL
jgi:uncharacterized protein YndB with AHSA1/START domain